MAQFYVRAADAARDLSDAEIATFIDSRPVVKVSELSAARSTVVSAVRSGDDVDMVIDVPDGHSERVQVAFASLAPSEVPARSLPSVRTALPYPVSLGIYVAEVRSHQSEVAVRRLLRLVEITPVAVAAAAVDGQ